MQPEISITDWKETLDSRSSRFTSREGTHCKLLMGGWAGPSAGLDVSENRKISCFSHDFNLGSSSS